MGKKAIQILVPHLNKIVTEQSGIEICFSEEALLYVFL